MKIKVLILVLASLFGATLYSQEINVLFLGNSYTYVNNLPNTVKSLAQGSGKTMHVDNSTVGGWTLKQHSEYQTSLDKIRQGNWDVVVLQDYSQISTADYYRYNMMYPAIRTLKNIIKEYNPDARIVLYMTWGRRDGGQQCFNILSHGNYCSPPFADFGEMQDVVTEAYCEIANEIGAEVAPVGEAWRKALHDTGMTLHDSDASHPSTYGTYLAALVFHAVFWNESTVGLPACFSIPTNDASTLQSIADDIVLNGWNMPCTINVTHAPANGGTVSGGGIYDQGTTCTVTATAKQGYQFVNWTENGSPVSTDASYTFKVIKNRTLVANFIIVPIIHTDNDTFYDSGGESANYANNEDWTVTYYPETEGNMLKATFTSFNTETGADKLYVYDGVSASAQLIGTYSGTASPGTAIATNPDGALTFRFKSDGSVNKSGWMATIKSVKVNQPLTIDNGFFYDSGGAGANYSNNEDWTVTYHPETAGKMLQFSFTSFSTEKSFDNLYIYDGVSTAAEQIGTYSGTTSPGTITATNADGALTFRFKSDGSKNEDGWEATISTIEKPHDSEHFYDTGGPDGNYSNNEDWTETYYPDAPDKLLQFTFTSFSTEKSFDRLYVYDGVSTAARLIGTYSGTTSPGTITATNADGALTFRFKSDGSKNEAGWEATISTTEKPHDSEHFYDTGGPDGNYSNNEEWTVIYHPDSPGKMVQVAFTSFSTEKNFDKLYVYDGASPSSPRIGIYSGTKSPGIVTATNADGALTFYFKSDGSKNEAGWEATIATVDAQGNEKGFSSIKETTDDADVYIYPNPASDLVTIEASGMERVAILNIVGQTVYSIDTDGNNISIDLSNLSSGMYIVSITTKKGILSKQIIVE